MDAQYSNTTRTKYANNTRPSHTTLNCFMGNWFLTTYYYIHKYSTVRQQDTTTIWHKLWKVLLPVSKVLTMPGNKLEGKTHTDHSQHGQWFCNPNNFVCSEESGKYKRQILWHFCNITEVQNHSSCSCTHRTGVTVKVARKTKQTSHRHSVPKRQLLNTTRHRTSQKITLDFPQTVRHGNYIPKLILFKGDLS
jgi:hypothetical protein